MSRTKTIAGTFLFTVGLLSPLPDGLAEDNASVRPGSRVRITTSAGGSKRLIGTIVAEDEASLTLETAGHRETMTVPRTALMTVEVSRRRSQRGRGAGRGALAGGFIGAILGYASGDDCSQGQWLCFSHETMATAGIIVFAPIGALIGAIASPGEHWELAPNRGLRISARPYPVRGRGVGLSVALAF
jgi:hypothetical protein